MSYTIDALRPTNPVLIIDDSEIELSLVTLAHDVIFKEKWGGLNAIFDKQEEEPLIIVDVVYELVKDKAQFNNSIKNFKEFVFKSKEGIFGWPEKMVKCFEEAVNKSMPLVKNAKRRKEIIDINKTQSEGSGGNCYASYYDTIGKRYPYTLDQFYGLTLRQLNIMLEVIQEKTHEELETQASLHGKKLKPQMKYEDISEEDERDQEKEAEEALGRLQKEYKKKQAEKLRNNNGK